MSTHAERSYQLIEAKANSNAAIQGFSGFFGLLVTLTVDAASIPFIYTRLWNDIRAIYNQPPIINDDANNVLVNILPEVLSDILFDKVLGNVRNVPLIGVYFNAICAKQMTWRLGTLFTMLASRGENITDAKCKQALAVIRHMFPQKDMFKFTTPDHAKFIKMVDGVANSSVASFNQKMDDALAIFENR